MNEVHCVGSSRLTAGIFIIEVASSKILNVFYDFDAFNVKGKSY